MRTIGQVRLLPFAAVILLAGTAAPAPAGAREPLQPIAEQPPSPLFGQPSPDAQPCAPEAPAAYPAATPYGQQVYPAYPSYPGPAYQGGRSYPGQPAQPYPGQQPDYQTNPTQLPPGRPYAGTGAPSSAWPGQGPLVVPPISFVDIGSGKFGQLAIELEDAQFMEGAVDRLQLVARNMDLTQGRLAALAIEVRGGHFQDFTCDQLVLSTAGALSFDTTRLLNHRMLQFTTPAQAAVTATIGQASLNRFLNSPRTLERMSVTAMQKAGLLTGIIGSNAGVGLSFTGGSLSLEPGNRMLIMMQSRLGAGELSVPIPIRVDTRVSQQNGWVALTDTHISASGQEISPELAAMIVNKVNGLSSWGNRSEDIHFMFNDVKVLPGGQLVLKGTAEIRRLRFGDAE